MRACSAPLADELLVRFHGIENPSGVSEQEYLLGLRKAAVVGIEYGLGVMDSQRAGIEAPQVPAELLIQAQLAARNEVPLETVLRRYCGANNLFTDALVEASEAAGLSRAELQSLLRSLAVAFDRLLARVGEEYTREAERRPESGAGRRVELARRLLDGELIDTTELGYCFDCWHLGLICSAPEPVAALRQISAGLDRSTLIASPAIDLCWAWLGGARAFEPEELEALLDAATGLEEGCFLAFGEPASGLAGWRLSHRQAASALPVARRSAARVSRYSEVSLLASALRDETLARSLHQLFLDPLSGDRDQGRAAKQTLRAYFNASHNVSSAAAALGVSRRTVSNRLAAIEQRLGRPLSTIAAEIETAIRLEELEPR